MEPAAGGGTTRRTEVAAAGGEIRRPRVAWQQAHGDDSQRALGKFDFFFFFSLKEYENHITSGMVGNSTQLYQLHYFFGAPLEELPKKPGGELVFHGVEWSCLTCLVIFLWS